MTIELNIFSGMLEPKKGSLDKNKDLPVYAGAVRAKNKSAAQVMLHGIFLQSAPELADDYFKPKVWEDGEGIPRPELMGVLTPDFFSDEIVWNAETGKPERVLVEPELADDGNQMIEGQTEEKMTAVKPLPANYRAASLVLFGPVEEITATQYGQIMDLVNDEDSSQARELMEAISREPRVLSLLPERQEELLAHLRATVKETAQWTDIKRPINKWLDTPPVKRDEKKPGMSELATRLRYRTAMGKLSRSMDFDVCSPPVGIEMRINTMLCSKDVEIDDWCAPFSRTPGIHDYHPASIVAIIKTADEKLHIYPGELRQYIDSCIAGFDCVNPPQLVIDIACGRTSAPLPQKKDGAKSDGKTEQTLQDENLPPAVCPARAAELDRELDAAFANSASNEGEKTEVTEQEDYRQLLDAHEIEIAHALNDLLSGRTDIMGKEEAEGVVTCTGHIIADILPLLIIDIATTEFCLSPNFSDEEVHDVATTILDSWSDDAAVRQKIALDAIVEYRRPEPPKPVVMDPPVVTIKPKKEPETVSAPKPESMALTYRQQLTLAALQGMCANPAYRGDFDELPHMAAALAAGVISAEAEQ
ncbi:Exodeoxyribonuclease VIII [Citrobacter portucalensis]